VTGAEKGTMISPDPHGFSSPGAGDPYIPTLYVTFQPGRRQRGPGGRGANGSPTITEDLRERRGLTGTEFAACKGGSCGSLGPRAHPAERDGVG
jgi:hypothetical protein